MSVGRNMRSLIKLKSSCNGILSFNLLNLFGVGRILVSLSFIPRRAFRLFILQIIPIFFCKVTVIIFLKNYRYFFSEFKSEFSISKLSFQFQNSNSRPIFLTKRVLKLKIEIENWKLKLKIENWNYSSIDKNIKWDFPLKHLNLIKLWFVLWLVCLE